MVSYAHVVYATVTCYFCYMLFNEHLCIIDTSYYCELVVGLRVQLCTLLEVWGGRLGIRMLTFETKTSL